ncbi:MAG: ABC transporter substrate-binding protein, partial [Spirochaetales bacterium]|nr:ABC transporter substrate-binding protein [Spirochaetales bacterium]
MKIIYRVHLNGIILISTMIILALSTVACTCSGKKKEPDSVTLQLNWFHDVEFAGYYVADAQGFYKEENLQVKILQRTPEIDFINSYKLFENTDFVIMGGGTIHSIGWIDDEF